MLSCTTMTCNGAFGLRLSTRTTCRTPCILSSTVALDGDPFSDTLLGCTVTKSDGGLGHGIQVQSRCRIFTTKSPILRHDLIAFILRIDSINLAKDAFIVDRCSIRRGLHN